MVMIFFKTEGVGYHVMINMCSVKKNIRLGSFCCYFFLVLRAFFPKVFVIG